VHTTQISKLHLYEEKRADFFNNWWQSQKFQLGFPTPHAQTKVQSTVLKTYYGYYLEYNSMKQEVRRNFSFIYSSFFFGARELFTFTFRKGISA
jgi:hypothetical protein